MNKEWSDKGIVDWSNGCPAKHASIERSAMIQVNVVVYMYARLFDEIYDCSKGQEALAMNRQMAGAKAEAQQKALLNDMPSGRNEREKEARLELTQACMLTHTHVHIRHFIEINS